MMNFRSRKTQRTFAVVIIVILVISMILPMLVSAFA